MTTVGGSPGRVHQLRRRARRLVPARGSRTAVLAALLTALVLGAVAGVVALSAASSTTGDVGPGRVEVRAALGSGRTSLHLPPFGTIWADTHDGPLGVAFDVQQVDVERVQALLSDGELEAQLREDVEADLRPLTQRMVRRSLLAAMVLGGLAGLLVPGRRWYTAGVGALGGVLATALLLGAAWRSFDAEAFEAAPVFDGPLAEAPRIVETVLRHVEGFEEIQDRYGVLSDQIADLYTANIAVDPGPLQDQTVVLHVSDIHLNPVGLELTRRLADAFAVDAVVDTGDLTSFGQPFEAPALTPLIEAVGVPYLYVPGNHDSPDVRRALADGAANLTILDGEMVSVGEVRVLGAADPTFTAHDELTHDQAEAAIDRDARRLRGHVRRLDPHLLAVHHPRHAWPSAGLVDTVIAGHYHHTSSEVRKGTRYFVIGTTGADGLGEFTGQSDTKYEAELLRWSGTDLVARDYVVVEGRDGDFRIARRALEPLRRVEAGWDQRWRWWGT